MSNLTKAVAELRSAHSSVQDLLEQATIKRHYGEIADLARIAQALSSLITQFLGEERAVSTQRAAPLTKRGGKPPVVVGASEYPQFRVEDDFLVKLAWSAAKKEAYEHRAPLRVLAAITARMAALSESASSPIKAEAVSDVGGHDDGVAVRGYQLYLCLGWLRRLGIIRQVGRRGYKIVGEADHIGAAVEEALNKLKQGSEA